MWKDEKGGAAGLFYLVMFLIMIAIAVAISGPIIDKVTQVQGKLQQTVPLAESSQDSMNQLNAMFRYGIIGLGVVVLAIMVIVNAAETRSRKV